jgi:Stress responsive A/B Barrel Domain
MQKSSRRQFLEKSTAAIAAATIMNVITETPAEAAAHKSNIAFVHHVFFWLKDAQNKKDHDQLLAALKGLGKIEYIKMAHIGSPSINEFDKSVTDASYSFSVMLVFNNKADEEKYLVHPLHKKFIDDNKNLWSKVVVYDSIAL